MADHPPAGASSPENTAGSNDENMEKLTGILDKVANFGRQHMSSIISLALPLAGVLIMLGALKLVYDLLTSDFLDVGDVIVACLGILLGAGVFLILTTIHGVHIFLTRRAAAQKGILYQSSEIVRAIAASMRGFAEAYLLAILCAIPFIAIQALLSDRDLAMIPFFETGMMGILVAPIVQAIFLLIFFYGIAELALTLVGLREDKEQRI